MMKNHGEYDEKRMEGCETKMFEFELSSSLAFLLSTHQPYPPPDTEAVSVEGKVKKKNRERLSTFVDSQSQLVYFSFEMIDETFISLI